MPPLTSVPTSSSAAHHSAFWATSPQQDYLVLFRSAVCGHCTTFTPEWNKFAADAVASNSPFKNIKVKVVNASPQTTSLMTYAGVSSYPTVYAYRNGKQIGEYESSSRTAADLGRFVTRTFKLATPATTRSVARDIAGGRRRTGRGGRGRNGLRVSHRVRGRQIGGGGRRGMRGGRRGSRGQRSRARLPRRTTTQRNTQRNIKSQRRRTTSTKSQRGGNRSFNGMNIFPSGPANVPYPANSPAAGAPYDVPSPVPPAQQASGPLEAMPPPPYNGGLYTGAKFQGPWGNLPVTPTAAAYTHDNLRSAQPPPGATVNYPTGATNRPGNSYSAMPGVRHYAKGGEGPNTLLCTGLHKGGGGAAERGGG